ncbi:hypothetical protein [Brachyspira sp.]|uniref:hypothetical protein n=1 Tax=Brachyspira sp. TaxID=1977261 RepID=UPI003D7D46CE
MTVIRLSLRVSGRLPALANERSNPIRIKFNFKNLTLLIMDCRDFGRSLVIMVSRLSLRVSEMNEVIYFIWIASLGNCPL